MAQVQTNTKCVQMRQHRTNNSPFWWELGSYSTCLAPDDVSAVDSPILTHIHMSTIQSACSAVSSLVLIILMDIWTGHIRDWTTSTNSWVTATPIDYHFTNKNRWAWRCSCSPRAQDLPLYSDHCACAIIIGEGTLGFRVESQMICMFI